jgi:hypothetical protein
LRLVEGHRHAGEFASWLAGRQLRAAGANSTLESGPFGIS